MNKQLSKIITFVLCKVFGHSMEVHCWDGNWECIHTGRKFKGNFDDGEKCSRCGFNKLRPRGMEGCIAVEGRLWLLKKIT